MSEVKIFLWATSILVFFFGNFTDNTLHVILFLGSMAILAGIYLTENIAKRGNRK